VFAIARRMLRRGLEEGHAELVDAERPEERLTVAAEEVVRERVRTRHVLRAGDGDDVIDVRHDRLRLDHDVQLERRAPAEERTAIDEHVGTALRRDDERLVLTDA
jgi:hypothetical protein